MTDNIHSFTAAQWNALKEKERKASNTLYERFYNEYHIHATMLIHTESETWRRYIAQELAFVHVTAARDKKIKEKRK